MQTPTESRLHELKIMVKRYQYRHARSARKRQLIEQQVKLIHKRAPGYARHNT